MLGTDPRALEKISSILLALINAPVRNTRFNMLPYRGVIRAYSEIRDLTFRVRMKLFLVSDIIPTPLTFERF